MSAALHDLPNDLPSDHPLASSASTASTASTTPSKPAKHPLARSAQPVEVLSGLSLLSGLRLERGRVDLQERLYRDDRTTGPTEPQGTQATQATQDHQSGAVRSGRLEYILASAQVPRLPAPSFLLHALYHSLSIPCVERTLVLISTILRTHAQVSGGGKPHPHLPHALIHEPSKVSP